MQKARMLHVLVPNKKKSKRDEQACALYGVRYGTLCTVRTVIL